MRNSPAKVASYFVSSLRVERDKRDFDEELGGTTCIRPLFPCSDSLESFELSHNFRREFFEFELGWEAEDQFCVNRKSILMITQVELCKLKLEFTFVVAAADLAAEAEEHHDLESNFDSENTLPTCFRCSIQAKGAGE